MYLIAALCLSAIPLTVGQSPALPTEDPFYEQPDNISDYQPGDIIASRSVSTNLNGILGPSVGPISIQATYQFLYRTVDSQQNPTAAVTTLLVPFDADNTKLLSYQAAYDASNINCAPSYSIQAGANNTNVVDAIMMTAALNKGHYILSSDYEGPQAAFTSGLQAGYATLDSIRAALSATSTNLTGLSPTPRIAMWGYSGGTIASEWAAELQPSYAPELSIQGVAVGGLVANITSTVVTIDGGPFAGLAFSGIKGLGNAYPDMAEMFDGAFVNEEQRAGFEAIAAECLTQTGSDGSGKRMSSYMPNFENLLRDETVQGILTETGQMGRTGVPSMPMYVYKPIKDDVSPTKDSDFVVEQLCAKGAKIEYRRNKVGSHATDDILGSGGAMAWIEDRLDGKPVENTGCTTENITITALDPDIMKSFGSELVSLLQSLLVDRLGPGSSVVA